MKNDLENLRKQIDGIDESIIILLAKRMEIVKKIGKNKKKLNLLIIDKKRFREILQTRINRGKKIGLSKNLIEKIYNIIHDEALEIEKSI